MSARGMNGYGGGINLIILFPLVRHPDYRPNLLLSSTPVYLARYRGSPLVLVVIAMYTAVNGAVTGYYLFKNLLTASEQPFFPLVFF